jgi:hypothetical protein
MLSLATLFDINYLPHGLTMRYSLLRQNVSFNLYILCLDEDTYNYFVNERNQFTFPIKLTELETLFPDLIPIKSSRKYIEYIFTLSPIWPLFLFNKFPEIDLLTTMDADLFFFSDPTSAIVNNKNYPIHITPHSFNKINEYREIYGKFNVSFQTFSRNSIAFKCLNRWKDECFNWCFDFLDDNRFADQKYLDSWPNVYENDVFVYDKLGIGIAPWNIGGSKLEVKHGQIYINNSLLIFYHFHHLRKINSILFSSGLSIYGVKNRLKILMLIYSPYLKSLNLFQSSIGNKNLHFRRYNLFSSKNYLFNLFKSNRLEMYVNGFLSIPLLYFKWFNYFSFIFKKQNH